MMAPLSRTCAAFVVALLAASPLAAQDAVPDEPLDPALGAELERALDAPEKLDFEALFRASVLAHDDTDPVLAELASIAEADGSDVRRRAARLLAARFHWRRGELGKARRLADDVLEGGPDAEASLLRAQLLDATGRIEEALEEYRAIVDVVDAEAQSRIRLRMAMIEVERETDPDALAGFAREEGRSDDVRNRAAIVLAILGRPEEAIELFTVGGEGTKLFRQEVRLAEWAVRAEDAAAAQEHAWNAVRAATLRRDRSYALTVLVEAHRADESLDALIERFKGEPDIDPETRSVWIDLLRETERIDEAVELFRHSSEGAFTIEMRRELLDMYREAGEHDIMVEAYRGLIESEPTVIQWREGLARFFLERGDRDSARDVWRSFLETDASADELLWAAQALAALGLDDLSVEFAETIVTRGYEPAAPFLFLFGLYRDRGELELASSTLDRLDANAAADSPARMALGEAFEQLGRLDRAVSVLEALRDERGAERAGEDLELRLSWLYSEVGDEDKAMESWRSLWMRIQSVPRRRYVEDRMMTVAARLGKLADIAIEVEEKLMAGTATERDSGLLVRLYTKVKDPVSATEIVEEFMKSSGKGEVETLQEKARVYLACDDYASYEEIVHELIVVDPEGEGDYLRQLAMSMLERGKPDEARDVLLALKDKEGGSDSAEFEAGVLALSGLRDEAVVAYNRGLAAHPNRIDSHLLVANVLKELGRTEEAIGTFQYLAETAEKDDLFTIAIDGLLNMEAPEPVMRWARRITLERLAGRHEKMYLYQLLSDLSEELEDREGMLVALENSLAVSADRRPSILRELMDLARATGGTFMGRGWSGDKDKHLAYGRRLIGLDQVVPPQVFLDLGEAFLVADDVKNASKTFRRAEDVPDRDMFERQTAGLFENADFLEEALRTYARVLVTNASNVGLLVKVGEMQEQMGRDELAQGLYARAMDLLLQRRPVSTAKKEKEVDPNDRFAWYAARNVDDFDQFYDRVVSGLLVTTPEELADSLLDRERALCDSDLETVRAEIAAREAEGGDEDDDGPTLASFPRLHRRTDYFRRLALAFDQIPRADELDRVVLAAFPEDDGLLERLCRERVGWGLVPSARGLIDSSGRSDEQKREVLFLVGGGGDAGLSRLVPLAEATGLFLPLLTAGRNDDAKALLRRVDFASVEKEEVQAVAGVFSAALFLGDEDLTLFLGREWLRLMVKHKVYEHEIQPVIQRCAAALDEERKRSLYQYFVSRIFEDPEANSQYITMLPTLQKACDEPLASEDEVMDLLDEFGSAGWGLGPVLLLLPEEDRAAALRTVWPKVQKTMRSLFLIQLLSQVDEPFGQDLGELVVGSFEETLEDANDSLKYWIDDLFEAKKNARWVLPIADAVLAREPANGIVKSLRAVMLLELEREDEALEAATAAFVSFKDTTDYYERNAQTQILEAFLPVHLDAFVAAVDEKEAREGESVVLTTKRLDLVDMREDEAASLAALERALEQHPDEKDLLTRLRNHYRRYGHPVDELRALERLVEAQPDEANLKRQLLALHERLRNPVRALELKEELDEMGEDSPPAGSRIIAGAGQVIYVSAGGVVTVMGPGGGGGRGSQKKEDVPGKAKPATIGNVKESVEKEDHAAAQTTLRRMWRAFQKGEGVSRFPIFYSSYRYNPTANMKWPVDEKEDAEEEKEPSRGGLETFEEEEPEKPEERVGAWRVLGEHDFGVGEMKRLLRTQTSQSIDGQQPIFEALLHARSLREGDEAVLDDLLATVRAGRGGKFEYVMLLALLDEHPERVTEDTRAILDDLVQTLNPLDAPQLRRLARAWARTGAHEQATRMYRWCATRTQVPGLFFFNGPPGISPNELVEEVRENLEGDDRLAVIDAILTFCDPGDDNWGRENYELLSLETWEEMFGPTEALERFRAICEASTDFDTGLRRNTAKRAAYLYARAGELDRAIRCFEVSLCEFDPGEFPKEIGRYFRYGGTGYMSHADLRRLFPSDSSEWPDALGWYRRAASSLRAWVDEERMNRFAAVQALSILSRRLFALGEPEEARELVDWLRGRDDLTPSELLWVADVAREIGAESLADSVERELYDARRLHVERIPDVVARVLESDGAEEALAMGESAADYTLHPRLLDTLASAADALEDTERARSWRDRRVEAEAALESLKEEDEEATERPSRSR